MWEFSKLFKLFFNQGAAHLCTKRKAEWVEVIFKDFEMMIKLPGLALPEQLVYLNFLNF